MQKKDRLESTNLSIILALARGGFHNACRNQSSNQSVELCLSRSSISSYRNISSLLNNTSRRLSGSSRSRSRAAKSLCDFAEQYFLDVIACGRIQSCQVNLTTCNLCEIKFLSCSKLINHNYNSSIF